MKKFSHTRQDGFTLIEVMIALLILSMMALMSYRGLSTVLDTHEQVALETEKWQQLTAFFARFEQDVQLASPYVWIGHADTTSVRSQEPQLVFSRFASTAGIDVPRRVAYTLNDKQEVELWLWPALHMTTDTEPAHYTVLRGVKLFESQYMTPELTWVNNWPITPDNTPLPQAVRLRIVLVSGEEILRVFSLKS